MADQQIYFKRDDGALGSLTVSGDGAAGPKLPEGAALLSKAAYTRALTGIERGREAHRETVRVQEAAQVRDDYAALRGAGIPEGTARRLSGHAGEDSGAEQGAS